MNAREQVVRAGVAMFVLGVLAGVSLSWTVARHLERFRRARVDLRATIDQARGLAAKVRDEGLRMVKVGTVAVALVAFLALVTWRAVAG